MAKKSVGYIQEKKKNSSLGGFEPPTFRLTAERASRLRHRDIYRINQRHFNFKLYFIAVRY
jgi:hypothetical protein